MKQTTGDAMKQRIVDCLVDHYDLAGADDVRYINDPFYLVGGEEDA